MSNNKSPFLLLLVLITNLSYGQFTDVINSNRPGESQAAFSVGKTVFQAELGFSGFREDHFDYNYEASGFGSELTLRYGAFFEQLEFIADLSYQNESYSIPDVTNEHRSGLRQTTIGAKFLVYDPYKNYEEKPNLRSWKANHKFSWRQFIPAIGVYGGVNLDLSNNKFSRYGLLQNKKTSLKGMIITQNQFGKFVFVTNIILDRFPAQKSIDFVVTLTRGFNSRWSGFIESQGYNSSYYTDVLFRGGAAYLVAQNIQVDASLGTNLKNTPSLVFVGAGLAWRFDANYNEVMLRIPKEEKSKDEKKKDKKKEKAKKRLDAIDAGEKVK